MAKSLANCRAFSNDREATAATSASSHCSMPGTARRRAIDAALKIPHFTFFVIGSPTMSASKLFDEYPAYKRDCPTPGQGTTQARADAVLRAGRLISARISVPVSADDLMNS